MAEITAAVELSRAGQRAEARDRLTAIWERIGAHGDPLHRVTVAHFLADVQDDVHEELVGGSAIPSGPRRDWVAPWPRSGTCPTAATGS